MTDSDEDDSLESIVLKDQKKLKDQAQGVTFRCKTKVEAFKEARIIDTKYQKEKLNHDWHSAYYYLLLYVEICLKFNLHKKEGDLKFEKEIAKVLDNLNKAEERIKISKKGMLWQYQNLQAQEARELAENMRKEDEIKALPIIDSIQKTAITGRTKEQMKEAMDALRLPGQSKSSFSTIPDIAMALPPVLGKVIQEDTDSKKLANNAPTGVPGNEGIPPPPYAPTPAPSKTGGMSSKCSIPESEVTTLVLKSVIGDGSCAFRSIAQGLHQGKLGAQEEKKVADDLRRRVVQLLKKRGKEEMVGTGMTIEQVVLMKDSYTTYEAYCSAMSKSEYAGETEFWLLSEDMEIRIAIFMGSDDDEGGLEHLITYGVSSKTPVCLYWQRGRSEAGNHYDCLIPEDD